MEIYQEGEYTADDITGKRMGFEDEDFDSIANTDGNETEGSTTESEDYVEPLLKYKRFSHSVSRITQRYAVSAIAAHPEFFVLGTTSGKLVLFDTRGRETRRLHSHVTAVNGISIDSAGEYVGSCCEDGSVVIHSLQTGEVFLYNYDRPVYSVALDPGFSRNKEKVFVCGGLNGKLIQNRKGWLIEKEEVLHEGEGPIDVIRWQGSLIAWANQQGVKVYDLENKRRVTYIERPRNCPSRDLVRPQLHWESDDILLIGWGENVKVVEIASDNPIRQGSFTASTPDEGVNNGHHSQLTDLRWGGVLQPSSSTPSRTFHSPQPQPVSGVEQVLPPRGGSLAFPPSFTRRWGVVKAEINLDCYCAALSSWSCVSSCLPPSLQRRRASMHVATSSAGRKETRTADKEFPAEGPLRDLVTSVVVLGYRPPGFDEDNVEEPYGRGVVTATNDPNREEEGEGDSVIFLRPALYLICRETGEELTADELPIREFEKYRARDYLLAAPSNRGGLYSPEFYIVAPKDILVCMTRDVDDHVAWSLAQDDYQTALQLAQANESVLKNHDLRDIVNGYLSQLFEKKEYALVAGMLPDLLGNSLEDWTYWMDAFIREKKVGEVAPVMPIVSPRLPQAHYESVLKFYLDNAPDKLLETLRTWPKPKVSSAIERPTSQGNLYDPRLWISRLEAFISRGPWRPPHKSAASARKASSSSPPNVSILQGHGKERQDGSAGQHLDRATALSFVKDCLAELYNILGDHNTALRIYLEKRTEERRGPSEGANIFKLICEHSLWTSIQNKILQLVSIDEEGAIGFIVRFPQYFPLPSVMEQLSADRKLQCKYLHQYSLRNIDNYNRQSFAIYHDLQVALYAEYSPMEIEQFLKRSDFVDMDTAYKICSEHDPPLYAVVVAILARMGNTREALELILDEMDDIQMAVDFVQTYDPSLWDRLIDRSLHEPAMVSELLDHSSPTAIDPRQLIKKIPGQMLIQGLTSNLERIVGDYRLETHLYKDAIQITNADNRKAHKTFVAMSKNGVHVAEESKCGKCYRAIISRDKKAAIVYNCFHLFHARCLGLNVPERQQEAQRERQLDLKIRLINSIGDSLSEEDAQTGSVLFPQFYSSYSKNVNNRSEEQGRNAGSGGSRIASKGGTAAGIKDREEMNSIGIRGSFGSGPNQRKDDQAEESTQYTVAETKAPACPLCTSSSLSVIFTVAAKSASKWNDLQDEHTGKKALDDNATNVFYDTSRLLHDDTSFHARALSRQDLEEARQVVIARTKRLDVV